MKTCKQRARNTEKTQGKRRENAGNTGLKRSVLNEVLNIRLKRLNNSKRILSDFKRLYNKFIRFSTI